MSARMFEQSSRPELDRALACEAFRVDQMACASAAAVLRGMAQHMLSSLPVRSLAQELFLLISQSAICHQINWDFLGRRLSTAFDENSIDTSKLANISARDVQEWIHDYNKPERIRAKERAALLRDLGHGLLQEYEGDVLRLLDSSGGNLYGAGGLMERLDRFKAFREDLLRKKSNVVVHEIVREGIVEFKDQQKISPAIDYHIMRLYLRTGRVVPLHQRTLEVLKTDVMPRARLIKLLRTSVSEALSYTAFCAKLSVPIVNTIEWQLGREVCDRLRPRCSENGNGHQNECPNHTFCTAFAFPGWRALKEPEHNKSFY